MTEDDDVVVALRSRAAAGDSAVDIASWLREELGSGATFFKFASCLFLAFKLPVGAIRRAEQWSGRAADGSMSDEELEQLLSPLIPRSGPIGE
ncbi:hypothetical protein [Micromonospora pallida]|uniref:hypothetical protein n=1 Tax=Micromonospora pallida TaxID=145854 RepID=UPI00114CEE68|nr:hypothetical protein [Micromonospora pallida]